jgi:hypothetical protein
MRISKLVIGGFAAILFTFAIGSTQMTKNSAKAGSVAAVPQGSHVLVADGSDPLPKPHGPMA